MATYILTKDIIIPAGSVFDNESSKAKEHNSFTFVIGFGRDAAGIAFMPEYIMEDALKYEPEFFIKNPTNDKRNRKAKKLLEEVGVSAESTEKYLTATDDTIEEVLSEIQTEVVEITKATKLKDFKSKEQLDIDFKVYGGTLRSKVNKALGMGLNRTETDKMSDDDFFKKVQEFYTTKTNELSTLTDEKVKEELNRLKEENVTLTGKVDTLTNEYETSVNTIKSEYEQRLQNEAIERVMHEEASKLTYASDDFKHVFIKDMNEEARKRYNVLPDGTLQSKDGSNAVHPTGKKMIKHVSEFFEFYADEKKYLKKSNGNPNPPDPRTGVPPIEDIKPGSATAEMEARILAAQKK